MDTAPFHHLSLSSLQTLAQAFSQGHITPPLHPAALTPHIPDSLLPLSLHTLNQLMAQGFSPPQIGTLLGAIAQERRHSHHTHPAPELVWTGPEIPGTASRDTGVVVQELFQRAHHTILVATYALDPTKAQALFQGLADRMDAQPGLTVQFFVNLFRPHPSPPTDHQLVQDFSDRFRRHIWPGQRLPQVFYDRRSLSMAPGPKACLHAKCVVIDQTQVLITSANFTEAAHHRNIETGILVQDTTLAKALQYQFQSLVREGKLCPLP